ncbi:MAG: hypothetical protein MK116_06675 [Phycisphaerales bacterium]|nr:hypothetical protein [Phycisphaerales bacterium]
MPDALSSLLVESHAWFVITGACGALLLFMGGSVVRLGVALAGLALGSLGGWMLWVGLEIPVPGWLMMVVGALVALCLALLMARLVTAVLLGLVMAAYAVGLVLAWASFDPGLERHPPPVPLAMASLLSIEQPSEDVDPEDPMATMKASFDQGWSRLADTWAALPEPYHLAIGTAAVAGLLVGLGLGAVFANLGLVLMTSAWGSLLVLVAALGLASAPGQDGPWQSSIAMMVAWTAVSAAGWAIQWALQRRRSVPRP